MMILLAPLALVLQTQQPTVGDTVWLRRTVPVAAGHAVRAADWTPSEPVELLARGEVVMLGDSAEIAYPIVLWRPGQHVVDVPGPLLLGPGGTVDSLRAERFRLWVRSVLPPVASDSNLSPQPRAALVAQRVVSLGPLGTTWAVALMLLLPVHLWWRRRGKPARAQLPAAPAEALEPPLSRWADAGEYRAVAGVSAARLRAAVAERVASAHMGLDTERVLAEVAAARPEWPLDDLGDLLRSLDDARFGHLPRFDALELSRSTLQLRDRLLRTAA